MYLGDFKAGRTVRYSYPTLVDGVPSAFSSVTVEVYKDGSLVQSTTGVTHTENYDGKTGYNNVVIDLSADGSLYSAGSQFAVIATGTLNAVSGIQGAHFQFSIEDRTIGFVGPGAITSAAFAAGALDAVWSTASRLLTAGTNIVLSKGVGLLGLNDLSAAQVNSEVVDAINVDTYAEPAQGAPPATASIAAKIGYNYKLARNKITQDNTGALKIYADDGVTVDHKTTTTDDGSTYTRSEIVAGP